MTDDEFRDKFKKLLDEYDPKKVKDFLLTIVTFIDDKNEPDEIYMLGRGCAACITEALVQQVEEGALRHLDQPHKVH